MDPNSVPMENEICPNCKREVPQQNYLMHVAHCQRNMVVCRVCGEAVPKSNVQEHNTKLHALVECKDCRYKVQSSVLEHHRKTACGRRQVACPYCELELPYCDMGDHENYCGSRTEKCDECGELVMFKYQKIHLDSNHGFLKLEDEPGPIPSWETPRQPLTQRNARIPTRTQENSLDRNVNANLATVKTTYKPQIPRNPSPPSPRERSLDPREVPQREPITPYDATEDLRAKVKLVRHNLNDIKQSYLMKEDRRDNRNFDSKDYDVKPAKKLEKFTTNLVPYEKNKSHKINANALDENQKKFYNYLGEKEAPPDTFVPLTNVAPIAEKKSSNNNLGAKPKKHSHSHGTGSKKTNELGAESKKERACQTKESVRFNTDDNENREEVRRQRVVFFDEEAQFEEERRNGAMPKRTNGAVPKRGKSSNSRQRSPPSNFLPPQSLEEVILPCEFCEKMVPASELVQHETGCRPDLAQLNVSATVSQNSGRSNETENVRRASPSPVYERERSNSDEVELPCEFCFTLYPASRLLGHQQMCGV